ncbi:MAG: DNRLRE domain-containing protein, partial [Bdellovibrionota bacterium]
MSFLTLLTMLGVSIGAQAQTTTSFNPVADATVKSGSSSTNYGSASVLYVDGSPTARTYLKFDVQGLSGAVQSAKVRLYVTNSTSNGPELFNTSSIWSESSITYSNKPSSSGSYLDDHGSVSSGKFVEYNVLATVKSNGVYSFVLKPDSSDGSQFGSRESSTPPQLVIVSSGTAT